MIVRISRGKGERYDDYDTDYKKEMTVLDLLFHLQEKKDQTLAFRYSCRGAICGSCAVLVNGTPVLACRTNVSGIINNGSADILSLPVGTEIPESGLLIEPLPKLPVVRDLVVDWEPFFACYSKIDPVLKNKQGTPESEFLMSKDDVKELERYTTCILCALCWGACPVVGEVKSYPGPAALAKLYRFYLDPRENGDVERLLLADEDSGWWACDFYKNCKKVCPRGVPPNLAIGKARSHLKKKEGEK